MNEAQIVCQHKPTLFIEIGNTPSGKLYFFDFYVCQVCHFDLRMSKVYPTESIEKVHPWLATLINRAKVAGKWKDIL